MARPAATDANLDPNPPPPAARRLRGHTAAQSEAKHSPVKSPAAPIAVTAPAVPADQVFGNVITAQRDTATVLEHALRSQLAAREGQFDRDLVRLKAEFEADYASLVAQVDQQVRIIHASDAAIETLKGTNIVQLRSEAAA